AGAAAAAVAIPTVWVAQNAAADEQEAKLAAVDMELVLVAAQIDPNKSGTGITPGAKDHVLRVEKALRAKKLLKSSLVDGHFGSTTVSAYSKWQKKLGYSGLDANGMPGKTSLTKLGKGQFSVSRAVSVGSTKDSYGGKRVNTRTAKMLGAADKKISSSIRLTQGSYTSSNPGSAGTHDGGGVVDISVSGLSSKQRWKMVKALRTVGFAAWLRTPDQGFDYHIHAVAVADPDLSSQAQDQVHDYYFGKNGLASHAKDNTPSAYRVKFTWFEKYKR
ncbi:MAG: peptidoglycan-binding protein, partial [Stackebrandtia sp.]